jgi:hypothetical protein
MNIQAAKALMAAACCTLSVVHAQVQPNLSATDFNRIFDCAWVMQAGSDGITKRSAAALAYDKLQFVDNPVNGIPFYKKPIRALGTQFDQLSVSGMQGGAYVSLQGAQASQDAVLKHFAAQNRPFALATGPEAPTQSGMRRWIRTEVGPDYTLVLFVQDGVGELEEVKRAPGVSAYCLVGETSAKDAQALGLEPISEVQRVVDTNTAKPPAWGNAIIASGSKRRMPILASYAQLTAEQISSLLAARDDAVTQVLIASENTALSASQLDALIAANPTWASAVALARLGQLSPAQRSRVMALISTDVRDILTLREAGAAADALLMRLIDQGDTQAALNAFRQHGQPNNDHIDRVLSSKSAELRREFTLNIKFKPTPAQIERILNDPDPGVRIGLLRRKDVAIPDALISQGINHPDKNLQFWYQSKEGYNPTPAEIEIGLTSLDTPTRRGWLLRENIPLTQSQINRAFDDQQTRWALVRRANIKLSAEQVDRCLQTDDYQVRSTCVARADFELTASRFSALMVDANPNIPRGLIQESKKRGLDLTPFVAAAFQQGYPPVLIGMAKANMPFTNAQLLAGSQATDRDVQTVFCRLPGQQCKR